MISFAEIQSQLLNVHGFIRFCRIRTLLISLSPCVSFKRLPHLYKCDLPDVFRVQNSPAIERRGAPDLSFDTLFLPPTLAVDGWKKTSYQMYLAQRQYRALMRCTAVA